MAAGGGYSTLDDLLRFAHALESGKLISKAMLADATRTQPPMTWYGFGFSPGGEGDQRRYGHGGGAPGMNGELRIYPDKKIVIVALSNLDPPAASTLTDFIGNRLPMD
jgi:CubicO group peptidase (beta-lactamase class C family)